MPAVPAAIAAAVSTIGAAVGSATLAGVTAASVSAWLIQTASSIAISAAIRALTPKPNFNGGGITTQQTIVGTDQPRSIILGRYATAGWSITPPYVFDIDKVDRKYLSYVLNLSDMPIDGIDKVIVDSSEYGLEPQVQPGSPAWHFDDDLGRSVNGRIRRRCFVRFNDGTQTTVDPMMIKFFESYPNFPVNENFKMTGVAYSIITFKYLDKDDFFSGMPNVKFVVRGAKLYDPRKDSSNGGSGSHRWNNKRTWEFSSNPMVMIYNIARGIEVAPGHVWGLNAKQADLPISSWFAAMNACDANASNPSSTDPFGDRKRYEAGIEIRTDSEPLDVISELLKSCSGEFADIGGIYLVSAGAPAVSSAAINDDVILIDQPKSFEVSKGMNDLFNGVTAGFPDPRNLFLEQDAEPYFNENWEADDGRRIVANIKFPCVPFPRQVRRLMREYANDNRRQRQHQIVLPPSYINLNPTNTITWTSEKNGYTNKLFEIVAKFVDPETLAVGVVLRERNPADYNYNEVSDGRIPSIPTVIDAPFITDGVLGFLVRAVTLNDSIGSARKVAIELTWNSDDVSYSRVAYQIRTKDGNELVASGVTDSDAGIKVISEGILTDTTYRVRMKAQVSNSAWTAWEEVTTSEARIRKGDIDREVLDQIDELDRWIKDEGATGLADLANTQAIISNDLALLSANVAFVRSQLSSNVNWLLDQIGNNLDLSKEYTNTAITQQSISLQGTIDSLSARVDNLSAALVSDSLVTNGSFDSGFSDSWVATGTTSIVARDTGSSNTILANMPAAFAARISTSGSIQTELSEFQAGPGDRLQFKFYGASNVASRSLRVEVDWQNVDGVSLSNTSVMNLNLQSSGVWKPLSGRFEPVVNARKAIFRVVKTQGTPEALFTKFEVDVVNIEQEALISELSAATANLTSTMTLFQSNTVARFGAVEGRIDQEASTRSSQIGSVTSRLSSVESFANNAQANINALQISVANTNASLASTENFLAARAGVDEAIRDGSFARGIVNFQGSLVANGDVFDKDVSSTNWIYANAPADRFVRFRRAATGALDNRGVMPATEGEVFDVSFAYARLATSPVPRITVRIFAANGNVIRSVPVTGTATGSWSDAVQTGIVAPVGSSSVRVHMDKASSNTDDECYVTNISLKKRNAFENSTASDIADIRVVQANTTSSIASLDQRLTANINSLAGNVSAQGTLISNRYTKAETDSSISAAITNLNSSIQNSLGQKANSNTVQALTNRVTAVEGNTTSLSQSLTSLNSSLSNINVIANGKGKVFYQNGEPPVAERLSQNLWIDTTGSNNIPKRWNGSSWVAVRDKAATDALAQVATKAEASALNNLTTRVTAAEGRVTSQATSITNLNSSVGRMSAGGRFRMSTQATPTGADSRIGFHAEASDGQNTHSAAFYLVAESNGTTSAVFDVNRFAIATGSGQNANRTVPFVVTGGLVKIEGAEIRNLSVDTIQVRNNAISTLENVWTNGSVSVGASGWTEIQRLVINKGRSAPLPLFFRFACSNIASVQLQRQTSTGWTTLVTISSTIEYNRVSYSVDDKIQTYIDTHTGTGTTVYRMMGQARAIRSNNSSGGTEYWVEQVASSYSRRLIVAHNTLK